MEKRTSVVQRISDRIIAASFRVRNRQNIYVISAYAPTEIADEEEKHQFYNCLHEAMQQRPGGEMPHILGDFNAQVQQNTKYQQNIGSNAIGRKTTDNGERLLGFCQMYALALINTFENIPKPRTHAQEEQVTQLNTWKSPTGFQTQIDFIVLPKYIPVIMLEILYDLDYASDHSMLVATLCYQPSASQTKAKKTNICNLELCSIESEKYKRILQNITKSLPKTENVEHEWEQLKNTLLKAEELTSTDVERKKLPTWFNEEAIEAIQCRKDAYAKMRKSDRQEEESIKNKEIYLQCRKKATRTCHNAKRKHLRPKA